MSFWQALLQGLLRGSILFAAALWWVALGPLAAMCGVVPHPPAGSARTQAVAAHPAQPPEARRGPTPEHRPGPDDPTQPLPTERR